MLRRHFVAPDHGDRADQGLVPEQRLYVRVRLAAAAAVAGVGEHEGLAGADFGIEGDGGRGVEMSPRLDHPLDAVEIAAAHGRALRFWLSSIVASTRWVIRSKIGRASWRGRWCQYVYI